MSSFCLNLESTTRCWSSAWLCRSCSRSFCPSSAVCSAMAVGCIAGGILTCTSLSMRMDGILFAVSLFFKYLNYSYLQQFVLIWGHYSLSSPDLNDINHNRFYRILFLFFNKRASLSAAATMNCPVSVSNHLYRLPAWLVTVSVVSFYPHQLLYSNRLEIL